MQGLDPPITNLKSRVGDRNLVKIYHSFQYLEAVVYSEPASCEEKCGGGNFSAASYDASRNEIFLSTATLIGEEWSVKCQRQRWNLKQQAPRLCNDTHRLAMLAKIGEYCT